MNGEAYFSAEVVRHLCGYHNPALRGCVKGNQRRATKPGCSERADYVLCRYSGWGDSSAKPDNRTPYAEWQSQYCAKHVRAAAKRRGVPIFDRVEDAQTWMDDLDAQARAYVHQIEQEAADNQRRTMETYGRVLRLSGRNGRMYLYADNVIRCELNDGTLIEPCCWLEGGRLIDNRIRGHNASGHNEGCTHHD